MTYVDGFVAAVPTANREIYKKHAEAASPIRSPTSATKSAGSVSKLATRSIVLRSSAPELSNNIIQEGLAFSGYWSGTTSSPGR
jgi:hypothetical protein